MNGTSFSTNPKSEIRIPKCPPSRGERVILPLDLALAGSDHASIIIKEYRP